MRGVVFFEFVHIDASSAMTGITRFSQERFFVEDFITEAGSYDIGVCDQIEGNCKDV